MNSVSLPFRLLTICLLCWLFAFGWVGSGVLSSASEPQGETSPQEAESAKIQVTSSRFDLDKYAFSNLSEFDRQQVSQEVAATVGDENNANQLIYDFRAKQEDIRLYEVILLAAMSLCALAIVLKYMKDSKTCQARDMLNGTGLVLVIFSTVLVIIIADVEIQLTAAMGVLGGIAGYLFGTLRSSQPADNSKKTTQPATEEKSVSTGE